MKKALFFIKSDIRSITRGSGFVFFSATLFGLLLIVAIMNAWYASLSLTTPLEKVIRQGLNTFCTTDFRSH